MSEYLPVKRIEYDDGFIETGYCRGSEHPQNDRYIQFCNSHSNRILELTPGEYGELWEAMDSFMINDAFQADGIIDMHRSRKWVKK